MSFLIKALHLLPPEAAHNATLALLKTGLAPACRVPDAPVLRTTVWGREFPNPIGLSAGFDKNAEVVLPLLNLGFGFVEAGTVTPRPQAGNPSPRIFRWSEQRAVINRLGFNNKGLEFYCHNLIWAQSNAHSGIIGGNIGKNKDSTDAIADYLLGLRAVSPLVDYLTINISSPNTPGLRGLQNRDELNALLQAIQAERQKLAAQPPLLVKIAPDLDEQAITDIAEVVTQNKIDGLIISNTTISRPAHLPPELAAEAGGLSGPPVLEMSNAVLARMARLTQGKLPLIGVGGVSSGADAYRKIRLGASLVQLYTALIYHGPSLVGRIKTELAGLLERDGFQHVADAVGIDVKA